MKIRYPMLKSLISSVCLISVGGQSLISHAMEYNDILAAIKGNRFDLSIPEEIFEHMKKKGYTIQKFLGYGHSGLAFLATDSTGRLCVLKFTDMRRGGSYRPQDFNVSSTNELPEKYRGFFKDSHTNFVSPTGDCLLYDTLQQNGIVNLGANACDILGIEKFENNNMCVILEYIEGATLLDYIKKNEYNTNQVRNWLKGICNSLKIMYKKDFLHLSIGVGNIKIRTSDNSAVLFDYERASYKGLIETLRNIRQNKYNKGLKKLTDEYGEPFMVREPYEHGQFYDLACLRTLINDIMNQDKKDSSLYVNNNQNLHNEILKLKEVDTLEDFLKGVDKL